jgi:hypothetical protein
MASRPTLRMLRFVAYGAAWIILAAALFVVPAVGHADERIWTALVLASNVENPKAPAPELSRLGGKVQRFFGYNQVQLIGAATKSMDEDCERWLVPSQNFWFSVKAKQKQDNRYLVDIVLFHDKRRLVETQAKLGVGGPLVIRGPMHAKGQLLIVVQVLP